MYLDLWRILRKNLNEGSYGRSPGDIIRLMDALEASMKRSVNWEKNAHKALKHLRKIDSYNGLNEDDHENLQ